MQQMAINRACDALRARYPGSTFHAASLQECALLLRLAQRTLVFLVETEQSLLSDMGQGTFMCIQKVVNDTDLWTGGHGTLCNEKAARRICTRALETVDHEHDELQSQQIEHIVTTDEASEDNGLDSVSLRPDEVLIEIKAVGISPQDLLVVSSKLPDLLLGLELAGIVVQAGSSCKYSPGDRVLVFGPGSCQTTTKVPQNATYPIPALADKMKYSDRLVAEDAEIDVGAPLQVYRVDSLLASRRRDLQLDHEGVLGGTRGHGRRLRCDAEDGGRQPQSASASPGGRS
ncbi:hypothetical protein BO71DRAFT_488463 [Aspergillus ellipticus CBS 707.79]|uniref:Enoyl reductase (ER) domain-containing protein n=1 Tax=Aspergillus ellipticus CBS 707.79 TaxID=1448320 RepID=A0A319DCU7_9EURO|nr:hypothetical protein BO71DRAFT_488463 [Aspergillus ellipticus CBS 707.79]